MKTNSNLSDMKKSYGQLGSPMKKALATLNCCLMLTIGTFAFTEASYAAPVARALLAPTTASSQQWGTYLTPFTPESPWNARPLDPVFGDFVIPKSSYFPAISTGAYSTGVFLAKDTDPPVSIRAILGKPGVWDPDAEVMRPVVVIPRWPADLLPATGNDGHADILDPVTGIIHSFWKLMKQDGQWVAAQYAWTRVDGRGWGDPAHYFQGARAAAVPTSAGILRKHEIDDGQPVYRHALAMSLTFNGLAPNPAYIFPATSADTGAATKNSGLIPEGALMMLPPSFDTTKIANLALRKVADTLKVYGAYVVDQNYGTPFAIYVENGANFNLHAGGWNNAVAGELDRMRAGLRQVVSTSGWLNGNGQPMVMEKNFNRLSMRGPWQRQSGTSTGVFDTWEQAVVFPSSSTRSVMVSYSSRGLSKSLWATPPVGAMQRLTASAKGGAKLRMQVIDKSGGKLFDSGELGAGESASFAWPSDDARFVFNAISGIDQPSLVRGDLVGISD